MNKTLYIIIALLLASLTARPQGNNAVSITIIGSGSYSAKLSDFYKPGSEGMLTILLRNQDLKEATIPVQLYMSVSNLGETYMLTKSPNITPPIHLTMGETKALTGKDLDCIFNTNYLTFKGTEFKENTNILKIYARDMRTGKVVSNTASITLKSVVIGAPKLLAPDNGIVIETDNPFHLFRWQGDNGGSHKASAYNYFYSLEIWRQNNNDPNVEVQRPPDFYADYLKAEQYQMLFSSYPFEIGQKYCWRVRAYDPTERTTFINEGKSEVRSFTYKHLPVPVTGLTHKIKETTRVATATWNSAEGHTKYYIEYYNPQTKKTISNTTNEPKYTLSAAPEGDYKILFRVKAQCWNDDNRQSSWTPWDTIHYTPRPHVESEYECGHKFPKVEITNYSLKTDFEEGDIVSEANGSSNYEIINCTADADSTLRGQFYLVMDAWGGTKIACDFWDTKINTDNVIITTRYRNIEIPGFVVDPDEIQRYVKSLWLDANSVATSSKIRDTIVIDEKFDYLYIADDGTLYAVVVNPDGTTNETAVHTNKSTSQCLITDGQGDSLVISQKGQVMGIQEYRTTGGNRALLNEIHRKSDSLAQWQINFKSAEARQTYAFDRLGSGNHGIFATEEYYPTSGNYDFRYKSVECGQTDRVVVDFGSYSEKDSVIFKDKYGVKLKVVDGNILTFTGVTQADTNFIYAYRGDKKIGKLFLNTYQRKTYKVVLVSVNDATLPNTSTLADYLNKVYRQCVDSFKIETRELQVSGIDNFTHGGTKVAGSVWNESQKTVLEAFGEKYEDNTAYLFFIPKAETGGVAGYMPRYYPYGFIYPGASERTIAHELGHGIAGLEHPFPESQVSGRTDNLMDYREGEELWHFQWDMLQDPARKIFKWWQNEEGAEDKILYITLSKLPDVYSDGTIGNRYGYDDMETTKGPNSCFDDHVSVKTGGATYLSVSIPKKVLFESLEIKVSNPVFCDVEKYNDGMINAFKVVGKLQGSTEVIIKNSNQEVGRFYVNVYNEAEIEQIIYYSGYGVSDINVFNNVADNNLKYLVAKSKFNFTYNSSLVLDANKNGIIDKYLNNVKLDEYQNLIDNINGGSIFLLQAKCIRDTWSIGASIGIGDTKIQMPNNYLSALNNRKVLTICDINGNNQEQFVILSIDKSLSTVNITTSIGNTTIISGFKKAHSSNEIIIDETITAGFSSNDPNKGVVVMKQHTTKLTGEVLLHEIMHKYDNSKFLDVNKEGNVMHWITSKIVGNMVQPIPIDIPFRFKELEEVETGNGKTIIHGRKTSQWESLIR